MLSLAGVGGPALRRRIASLARHSPTAMGARVTQVHAFIDAAECRPGLRVWVLRAGAWRPGIVLSCSPKAVMVRYRPTDGPGTGVDTVTFGSLSARDEHDLCDDEWPDHARS
jgi:hypothetical protein